MSSGPVNSARDPLRGLKVMTVLNLILLSIQAWTGDVVNLFAAFPKGPVSGIGQMFPALLAAGPGPLALWHGIEGLLIVLLSIGVAVSAFRSRSRSLIIVSLLALFFVASAVIGGYLFTLSGFLEDSYSAQMGGAFIGAYAMSFLVLYYSK